MLVYFPCLEALTFPTYSIYLIRAKSLALNVSSNYVTGKEFNRVLDPSHANPTFH